jgi:REP element-mobilizing transposase RayT
MPRKARIDAPGALHHIIVRGIDRCLIFRDNRDRDQYLERLGDILTESETPCYAWALMPNHFHLLLKNGLVPLASVMRRLLTGHAISFNRRHRRHGHLFQNRYKSILCQEEAYLRELVRYIHLNPLRAGLVDDIKALNRYLYSGHSALVGKIRREWQQVDHVLGLFGKGKAKARKAYWQFVEKGVAQGRKPELTGGGLLRSVGGWVALASLRKGSDWVKSDERILGDSDFVTMVLREADEQMETRYRLKSDGFGLDDVAQRVAQVMSLPLKVVWETGRRPQTVKARSLLCYWASRELGLSMTAIASRLGLTQPAVSIAARRGEEIARKEGYSLLDDYLIIN